MANDEVNNVEEEEVGSPFNFKNAKCPVCGNVDEMRFFKSKIYSERKTDLDKYVIEYGWQHPSYKSYYPPFYLFWHCYKCQYTDTWVDFERPDKEPWSNWILLKRAYVEKIQDDEAFEDLVSYLSEEIDYDDINYVVAMKLHLLAALIQTVVDDEDLDTLKIGRYFLRAGWLFRKLNEPVEDNEKLQKYNAVQLSKLEKILTPLKKKWDKIPLNEEEAVKTAVEYLTIAFTASPAIKTMVAEMDMLLWVATLHLKLKDRAKAMEMFGQVIARGQKSKQKIEQRIKGLEKSKSDSVGPEIQQLSVQLKKIGAFVAKARDVMADLQSERMKEVTKKAKIILKKIQNREPDEKRRILKAKGIEPRVIDRLVPEEKKKKFLGLF